MYCRNCGKEIDEHAVVCPNCGVLVDRTCSVFGEKKTNVLAIVGFILSFFVAIAGLICSIIARKQCRERNEKGGEFATAGMVISIVELSLTAIYVIIVIAFVLIAVATALSL